jgi:hypothetical protein
MNLLLYNERINLPHEKTNSNFDSFSFVTAHSKITTFIYLIISKKN